MKLPVSYFLIGLQMLFLAACGYKSAVLLPNGSQEKLSLRDQYVILIIIDGARPNEIDRGVALGHLPHFKELFYEQGARYQNALAVTPTVSSTGHQALLSGLYPGHHGIPNLDWFSRPLERYTDYLSAGEIPAYTSLLFNSLQLFHGKVSTDEPQLFFTALGQQPTLSVYEPFNYGATQKLPHTLPAITAFRTHYGKAYEKIDFVASQEVIKQFQQLPKRDLPRFTSVSLYGMDLVSHKEGPTSARAMDLYIYYDRFLGELRQTLKKRGIWDFTTLIITSDHGQHTIDGIVDLPGILTRMGFDTKQSKIDKRQVIWGDHGVAVSNLYFKMGSSWKQRPQYSELLNYPLKPGIQLDLIESMLANPDIEYVVAKENLWKVHVHKKGEHAVIKRQWRRGKFFYSYQPDPGSDPFNYLSQPQIREWVRQKRFLDSEAWLKASHNLAIPDAIATLPQIFDDYRIGDMLVFTVKNKHFKVEEVSSHGSLYAEDKRIPLMFHGPNIKPGLYPYARSVDLYPTVLALFGLKSSHPIDGKLRAELISPSPNLQALAFAPPNGGHAPMNLKAFYQYIMAKQDEDSLEDEERAKAKQLFYALKEFLAEKNTTALASQSQKSPRALSASIH